MTTPTERLALLQGRIVKTLLSWPFLLSLVVLIINDSYLKLAYPGWLTGKLSDVAGVYLVALLIFATFPKRKYFGAAIVALSFIYWKSPASQWLIDSLNFMFVTKIGRVVDYSDLLALISIPLAWVTISGKKLIPSELMSQRLLSVPVAAVTVLAVAGTSVLMPRGQYSIRNADHENRVDDLAFVVAIERVTVDYDLQCEKSDVTPIEVSCSNDDMQFSYTLDEIGNGIFFQIHVTKMDGFILPDPDYELFEDFLRDLKIELGNLSPSMEFVEDISGRQHIY